MATVKSLIKNIFSIDDSQSEQELKKLKKAELQEILDDLNNDDGLEYDEDYVEDSTIERTLVESVTHPYDKDLSDEDYFEEEEEEIEIDISKLSKYEQRHYAKTGQLPQVTINRYTRFGEVANENGE